MSKKTSLIPFENKAIIASLSQGLQLTVDQEQTLRANLPSWIPDKENLGTAVSQTALEFLVLVEEILVRDHGFSEKEIVKLERKIKQVLPTLAGTEVERDLSILRPKDMQMVIDIAEKRYERLDEMDKHYFGIKKQKLLK
ncbi:MAG: hypothetical protein NUV97_03480 [archaeon]|nr:hypothetical protein [archaeon]